MKIKTFIVDAFTDKPFKGNPAGVCVLDQEIPVETMQSIAKELNLSETAFLQKTETSDATYSIKFFTPTVEVPFCGHATLASAKVLIEKSGKQSAAFKTFHDLKINAEREGNKIKMKFPLYDAIPYEVNQELYDALDITDPITTRFAKELEMLIIEIKDKDTLINLKPNFERCLLASNKIKEVVVTAKSNDTDYDFYSRCFCPWIGINEDPVTGASHSVLAKYWGNILNKTEMYAYQASDRGGYMKLNIINATELEVRSDAVIVLEGVIEI